VGAKNEEAGRHENATDVDNANVDHANLAYPTIDWVWARFWAGFWAGLGSRLESAYG
jgi:hypothetical protein